MDHSTVLNDAASRTWSVADRVPAIGVILFGIFVVYLVGFLNVPQAHNATHDTRHATGFPCH
jgi:cobalt transporter subunit CbtB